MSRQHDIEDHDRGLTFHLDTISRAMIGRRRALAWFASAGAGALVAGCGGGSDSNTGRFTSVSRSSDGVFGDNSAAQIASMTSTLTGSPAAGYTGSATIGLAV